MSELISTEPATGAELWRGQASDVDAAVAAARDAFPHWAMLPLPNRIEAVRRYANVVRGRHEQFADLIARETGKPLWEARTEVDSVINKVEISIEAHQERTPHRQNDGELVRQSLRHKPHGVLAVLGPYNFPAHLPNGHIVPALIAGNAVVFKPSEKTPASGEFLIGCLREAGLPDGVTGLVQGGPETGKALAGHNGLDGLLFTGSAPTGVALSRQFANTPGRILALEMGGNNPIVVWEAPDLYAAAVLVAQSAFLSAGQRCTAARRLIVRDELFEPLVDQVIRIAQRLIVGDPHANPAPFMGPVIDNPTAELLLQSQDALADLSGQVLLPSRRPVADRPFLTPGLIDMTIARERPDVELFGPLLQVIRVSNFDRAIAEANATQYGLSAALVGGTPEMFDHFWANVRAGIINWNKPTNGASSSAPFGGVGLSGNHRPSAYYAADYCAYPVVSTEENNARAAIAIGLRKD